MFKTLRQKGFAPVVPIDLLHRMHFDYGLAGSYHLPLAHDVLKRKDDYHTVFEAIAKQYNSDRVVIMDNSVIETGGTPDCKQLVEACEYCLATHLVLPDVLQDGLASAAASVNAYLNFPWGDYYYIKFAVVPQGKNFREWLACAEILAREIDFDLWCIPRNFEERLGTRWDAASMLQMIKEKPIHLLGFSDYIYADMAAAQHPSVIGIDSAVPIRMGQAGEMIKLSSETPPRGDWWETVDKETKVHQVTIRNLRQTNIWINGGNTDQE